MGNRQPRNTNPDLLEYCVYPTQACTLGRFEQTLGEAMDPRLYYFMSKQDYVDELREFDRRIFQAESEGSVCCLKYDIRQTEHDLQVISMQASGRHPPLQFQLLSYYRRGKKRWMGWLLRVLLPPGTTERFNTDLKAGRVPTRLVLVAPVHVDSNGVPMRLSMGQPGYGSVEGGQVPVGSHPPGYVASPGKVSSDYVAVPSAPPVEGAPAGPPPYSRFEDARKESQPPIVQKPQMI